MSRNKLVTLIAAAVTLSVAATAGFVDPQPADYSPADSRPFTAENSAASEQSLLLASGMASLQYSTAQEDPRRSLEPSPARCEADASAVQAVAAGEFCPMRRR